MKTLTSIILLCFISVSYTQAKYEPDSRIIKNLGQSEAENLTAYRPNYYNYLVYQLNFTCSISEKNEAKKATVIKNKVFKNLFGSILTKQEVVSEDFNYTDWGIQPDHEITNYYLLEDGSYLKVFSVRALTNLFKVSPKNTKNLY